MIKELRHCPSYRIRKSINDTRESAFCIQVLDALMTTEGHQITNSQASTFEDCDDLNMLGQESGTIRMCGLVEGSVSLWGWALRPSS